MIAEKKRRRKKYANNEKESWISRLIRFLRVNGVTRGKDAVHNVTAYESGTAGDKNFHGSFLEPGGKSLKYSATQLLDGPRIILRSISSLVLNPMR